VSTGKSIDSPVTRLRGVGAMVAAHLERLGIATIGDLLLHLPFRYEDRTRVLPIRELRPGGEALVVGDVIESRETYGRRRSWIVVLGDDSGFLTLRFFHFRATQRDGVRPGSRLRCFGEARLGPNGMEMAHPEYQVISGAAAPVLAEDALTPVYRAAAGLTQNRLRGLAAQALTTLDATQWPDIDDALATGSAADAIRLLHRPPPATTEAALSDARSRLAMEELAVHIRVARAERKLRERAVTEPLPRARQLGRALLDRLGFDLTAAQRRVTREVLLDMERTIPMLRLLQGDVGSGKTVIAAFAAIRAAENGRQTAIMAPTEILAEQHYLTFSEWLEPLGIPVTLVTGQLSARERRQRSEQVSSGDALVVVGTHALFQRGQAFADLALTIIDEQHRFGVHQRMALLDKGRRPHQLVMTATPIPRTLTMTLYANMDVSVLDELPAGRKPVRTVLVAETRRDAVIDQVAAACRNGAQAYWVCTLIDESDALEASAAETTAAMLRSRLPDVGVGLIHGRMGAQEKAAVMSAYKRREFLLLVATTVVEVGVDVPNASVMVIENAERLGLAQLHQLRGRVGRGQAASHCILMYKPPVSALGRARLKIMRETSDGFAIAEEDLKLRGPGDLLGTRQTGELAFRVADLGRDAHLMQAAERIAACLADSDELSARLARLWAVGGREYAQV
jgi:ATP-dependent DNA helicase RecG